MMHKDLKWSMIPQQRSSRVAQYPGENIFLRPYQQNCRVWSEKYAQKGWRSKSRTFA